MRLTIDKDVNTFINGLLASGWSYSTSGKHLKLFSPKMPSRCVVVSKTPSDRRTLYNIRHVIKMAELQ